MRHLTRFPTLLFCLLLAPGALATIPSGVRVSIDTGFFTNELDDGTSNFHIAPELEVYAGFGPVLVEARLGMPFLMVSGGASGDSTEVGTPSLYAAAHYVSRGSVTWRAGLGLGYHFGDLEPGKTTLSALRNYDYYGVTRGQRVWMAVPEQLSIVPSGAIEYRLSALFLQADLALAILVGTGDVNTTTELDVELGAEVGVSAGPLEAGLRFQFWWMATNDDGDNFQSSLVPFVRLSLGMLFIGARLVMNLDDPYGFAFDKGKVWGAFVTLGAGF